MVTKVYDALAPLWQQLQDEIASASAQQSSLDDPHRVCFVGRFKTGKSRLINALVGADVLPYNTDECTAQLVEMVHGNQDEATRLDSHDLDTAAAHPLTDAEFRRAVDLTAISSDEKKEEDASFRRYIPSSLLQSVKLLDTPGFDGPNSETRRRAEKVRERAIQQSRLCVLVLSAGLSADDMKCALLVQQHGAELIVVLNQSDKYDAEQRQEMKEQIVSGLQQEMGMKPSFFACSALWQNGSEQDKRALEHQRRYFDDEDEAEWHQWDALIACLSRGIEGEKHLRLLTTISHVFDLAAQVNAQYDISRQAEATFLDHLPRWRNLMPSLVGQTVLILAVDAAKSKKPLPWKRLQPFGIVPDALAPPNIMPTDNLGKLFNLFTSMAAETLNIAENSHDAKLYRALISGILAFLASMEKNYNFPSAKLVILKSISNRANWYSQPLRKNFTYKEALLEIQTLWNNPQAMNDDCARIRKRLAAAMA